MTAGLLLSTKIEMNEAIRYWIAQVLGAIVAALVLFIVIERARAATTSPTRASAPTGTATTRRTLSQLWLFIVAPLIGATLASLVHTFLFTGAAPVEPEQSAVGSRDARRRGVALRGTSDRPGRTGVALQSHRT